MKKINLNQKSLSNKINNFLNTQHQSQFTGVIFKQSQNQDSILYYLQQTPNHPQITIPQLINKIIQDNPYEIYIIKENGEELYLN